MLSRFAEVLPQKVVRRVHEVSLEVLDQVGLLVRNEKARSRFRRHGCRVDDTTQIVTFPTTVVEEFRAMVPPTFTFHARNEVYTRTIPRDALVVATASSAPNIIDPDSGRERRATSEDIARAAHLITHLEGVDIFSVSALADDAPPDQVSLSRFYPSVKNCWKPVRTSVFDVREARQVLNLGAAVAGSEQRFRENPFITFGYCSIVDPLTMDFDSTEMLMFYAEQGLPAYGTIAPIGGISAPLSMIGMLAQINAEWLATAVLAQMSKPGTAMIYNFLPVVGDMRTGAYAPGAVETGIMAGALVGLARHYNVPCGAYLGLTNSKLCDAQAGFEKAMSPTFAAAAGIDFIVMNGLIDSLMTFDFGEAVVDDEIARMLKRFRQHLGMGSLDTTLAEIRAAGPAGMFVDKPETLAGMKTCALLPRIADRERREVWAERGALDAHGRGLALAKEILCRPNPALLAPDVDARVRAVLGAQLVAGDANIPEAWHQKSSDAARGRRGRRAAPQGRSASVV